MQKKNEDHGIGRLPIRKGVPGRWRGFIEIALIRAELFIARRSDGFIVNDLAAAKELLGRGIVIDVDRHGKKD